MLCGCWQFFVSVDTSPPQFDSIDYALTCVALTLHSPHVTSHPGAVPPPRVQDLFVQKRRQAHTNVVGTKRTRCWLPSKSDSFSRLMPNLRTHSAQFSTYWRKHGEDRWRRGLAMFFAGAPEPVEVRVGLSDVLCRWGSGCILPASHGSWWSCAGCWRRHCQLPDCHGFRRVSGVCWFRAPFSIFYRWNGKCQQGNHRTKLSAEPQFQHYSTHTRNRAARVLISVVVTSVALNHPLGVFGVIPHCTHSCEHTTCLCSWSRVYRFAECQQYQNPDQNMTSNRTPCPPNATLCPPNTTSAPRTTLGSSPVDLAAERTGRVRAVTSSASTFHITLSPMAEIVLRVALECVWMRACMFAADRIRTKSDDDASRGRVDRLFCVLVLERKKVSWLVLKLEPWTHLNDLLHAHDTAHTHAHVPGCPDICWESTIRPTTSP